MVSLVSLTLTNPRLIRNIWSGCDTVPRRKPSIARHNQNLERDNDFLYFSYFFASLNSMLNIAEKSRTTKKYMLPLLLLLLLLLIDYKLILNIQTSSVYTTWHDTDSNSYTTLDCTTQGQF